jgi:hypothetical protein
LGLKYNGDRLEISLVTKKEYYFIVETTKIICGEKIAASTKILTVQ